MMTELRIEQAYDAYDRADIAGVPNGAVLRFDAETSDGTRTYAALRIKDHWYSTGSVNHGVPTEDFVAWLIEHSVWPDDIEVLS